MVRMMPTVSILLFYGALWRKSASSKHLLPKLSWIIMVIFLWTGWLGNSSRNGESFWRRKVTAFLIAVKGSIHGTSFPGPNINLTALQQNPNIQSVSVLKSLDTILSEFQPQLILTACCNEFHPAVLHLPRSETENKSINQVNNIESPNRCNNNDLLISKISSICFGQLFAPLQKRKTDLQHVV